MSSSFNPDNYKETATSNCRHTSQFINHLRNELLARLNGSIMGDPKILTYEAIVVTNRVFDPEFSGDATSCIVKFETLTPEGEIAEEDCYTIVACGASMAKAVFQQIEDTCFQSILFIKHESSLGKNVAIFHR